MNKRVLHIRSTIGMYGAEKVLVNILPSLGDECEHAACYLIQGGEPSSRKLFDVLTEKDISVDSNISRKKLDWELINSIRSKLIEDNINIIHTHDYKSLIHGTLARLGLKVKSIHHSHGALGNTINEKIYSFLEEGFKLFADKLLVVNSEKKPSLYTKKKTQFLANGIIINRIPCSVSSKPFLNLIMIARFTPEKNHEMAVEVASKLKQEGVQFKLTMLGDGALEEHIKGLISEKNLQDCIELLGFVDSVEEKLCESDILLITSTTEGMPMSLLEAMSVGVPAISTPVGSIPSIIERSHSGLVAATVDEFVEGIIHYSQSSDLLEEQSELAKQYIAENLSVDQQVSELGKIYDKVLGSAG